MNKIDPEKDVIITGESNVPDKSDPEMQKPQKNIWARLQSRWQTKSLMQLVLILCTFAIGGSLSGYLARKIMGWTAIAHTALWIVVYLVLVTFLWPACVLVMSIFFGQFLFFKRYLIRMASRLRRRKREHKKR